jgi:metallo-beta-lactamase family protein
MSRQHPNSAGALRVTFWGAAQTVTGSMHQVEAAGKNLLLDCGLFQGRRAEARRRNSTFPFEAKDVDAVLLSHAHIDHCGNLPNLLLGSAMVALSVDAPGGQRRITFTGDLGRRGLPILRDPAPVPACELLISESTYGGRTHEPVDLLAEHLGEIVRRTAERGGKVLIPAFSLGRTQTVVYFLHQLMNAGKLHALPIYVDSPLAAEATEVFRLHPECFDEETARLLEEHPDLFGGKRIHYIHSVEESKALNDRPEPCVVIAASGMCEAGRILHHLKHNIEDARNTVLIVGFQAPETLGRRLVEKKPEVRILGRTYKVRAEVVAANGFSSHADHSDFLARPAGADDQTGPPGPWRAAQRRGAGGGAARARVPGRGGPRARRGGGGGLRPGLPGRGQVSVAAR